MIYRSFAGFQELLIVDEQVVHTGAISNLNLIFVVDLEQRDGCDDDDGGGGVGSDGGDDGGVRVSVFMTY